MYYKQTDRKIVQNDFDRKDEGKMVEKMPLCPEERALSYCKYFDLPMEEPDPRSMHNMREYPHLGRFLPKLFAEEGWKPVDAY